MISTKHAIKTFSLIIAIVLVVSFMVVPLAACNFLNSSPKMCTVTFDTGGGSSVPSQKVERGSRVSQPEDPTLDGYEFEAWCKDSAGNEQWDFYSDTVEKDITLYAKWFDRSEYENTPTTCTITFDVNGGQWSDGSKASKTVVTNKDGKILKTRWVKDPERTDYTFTGWYLTGDGTGVEYTYNSVFTSDITLKAGWTKTVIPSPDPSKGTVTATFNVGRDARSVGASNPPAQTVTYGDKITEPTVTRKGYRLDRKSVV